MFKTLSPESIVASSRLRDMNWSLISFTRVFLTSSATPCVVAYVVDVADKVADSSFKS